LSQFLVNSEVSYFSHASLSLVVESPNLPRIHQDLNQVIWLFYVSFSSLDFKEVYL